MKVYLRQSRLAGLFLAATLTIALVGALGAVQAVSAGVRTLLARPTGHPWLTATVLTALLFPALAALADRALMARPLRRALRAERLWFWALVLIVTTLGFTALNVLVYWWRYLAAT